MKRWSGAGLAIVLALLLTLVLAEGVAQAQGSSVFGWVVAKKLTVSNDTSLLGDLDVAGDADVTGGLSVTGVTALTGATTVDGNLSTGGDLQVAEFLRTAGKPAITVTADSIITPTGTFQGIEAAGAVGTASIAAGSAGDMLVLMNIDTNVITITDTGTLKLTGNIALGQYDTLTMISDGTNWIQIATANN